MPLTNLAVSGVIALSLLGLVTDSLSAQSNGDRLSAPVWIMHAGRGTFARTLDVTTGSTSITVPVAGASIEVPVGRRLRFALAVGAGALLGGTQGGSVSSGTMLDAAALWQLTPTRFNWGVFAGPGVTHTRFGDARTGVGGVISAGVRRGIGPRLTVRSHAMSGTELGLATRVELGVVLTR